MPILVVIGQSFAIYIFLVVTVGRFGRMHMAGLTPTGLLMIALLGSSVETGLYAGSGSLWAGLASVATLMAANHGLARLMNRWPRLRRWLVGEPVVLVHKGRILADRLRQVRLNEEDLREAIRRRGYDRIEDVHLAVLEVDGSVGVVPVKKESGR